MTVWSGSYGEHGPFPGRLVKDLSHSSISEDIQDPPLRPCQLDCLDACGKGARIIEMACGTGKTRVIKELVGISSGRAPRLAFGRQLDSSGVASSAVGFVRLFQEEILSALCSVSHAASSVSR